MGRVKISKIKSITLILLTTILVGFFIRIAFVGSYIRESGDLRLYADWAEKFWVYGGKDFYTYPVWLYAPPNYPPILSLIYGGAYWLFNHKYVLPQLHNLIRVPPAAFIIYCITLVISWFIWGHTTNHIWTVEDIVKLIQ